ncbi:hypothetical protein THIOSC13_1560005 [uncultured Thiomicrorhabdus sp.]
MASDFKKVRFLESKKDQGSTFGIELPFKYQPSDTDKQDLHEFSSPKYW